MHRRTARANRWGLGLIGVLLVAGGLALVAAYEGWFGSAVPGRPIYPDAGRRFVHDNAGWLWPVVAAAAIVVAVVFARWLLLQWRVDRLGRLDIDTDPSRSVPGRTTMPASALAAAVEADVRDLHGVRRVAATVSGSVDAPEIWLSVTAATDTDLAGLRREIHDRVLPDARAALDLPALRSYLSVSVARQATAGRTLT